MRFFGASGLVMIVSGLGAYYATGSAELSSFSILNLSVGALLVILGAGVELRRFRGFAGVHSHKVVARWTGIIAAVVAAVLAMNALGRSWSATWDLTVERRYTLSEQTVAACEQLAEKAGDERLRLLLLEDALIADDVRLLLQAYSVGCAGASVREIRTAEAPPEASAVLQSMEATVLACGLGRCEGAGFPSEGNITNALVRLGRERRIEVHFLIGHGEADLASQAPHGFAALTGALRDEGLLLEALVGPARASIPESASLVIIAAPERNLLAAELSAFERYLQAGGRLLVLLEPGYRTNLDGLLERWGFRLPEGAILDPTGSPLLEEPQPISLLVNTFNPSHPITSKLSRRTMLLVPGARAVALGRKPEPEDQLRLLAYSGRGAWLEPDTRAALDGRAGSHDPDGSSRGEIPLAAAGRYPRGGHEARIVVIGDRDFASNLRLDDLYNRDLILNSVLWLAEDSTRIAIRPKHWTPDQDPLTLQQTLAYFYFMAFALPELLLLLGIHAWYRQRS